METVKVGGTRDRAARRARLKERGVADLVADGRIGARAAQVACVGCCDTGHRVSQAAGGFVPCRDCRPDDYAAEMRAVDLRSRRLV